WSGQRPDRRQHARGGRIQLPRRRDAKWRHEWWRNPRRHEWRPDARRPDGERWVLATDNDSSGSRRYSNASPRSVRAVLAQWQQSATEPFVRRRHFQSTEIQLEPL